VRNDLIKKIRAMDFWQGDIDCQPLTGGITNHNFLVEDKNRKYVVRLGHDIVEHQVMRFNELNASRAAHRAGISPEVLHHEPGIMVLEYIKSRTLGSEDIRDRQTLERILPLIKTCHIKIPEFLRGGCLVFWVFHVVRDYAWTLREGDSPHTGKLPDLIKAAGRLEKAAGPHEIVFGHNDLLAANFLDDGERLWLLDWDYAGFNSPLFDLGGLASNNEFDAAQETWLLETYFESQVNDKLLRRYEAMKCASLLRETMWSMVSEQHSKIDFDFKTYTAENLSRFQSAYHDFMQSQG